MNTLVFIKNGIFNQISHHVFRFRPIGFYSVKKWPFFKIFEFQNFIADIPIQLEKLSVLMCISTRLRTKYTEAWFFHLLPKKLELENQRLHWISKHGKSCAHCSQTRAHNSIHSLILVTHYYDFLLNRLNTSRAQVFEPEFDQKNHHEHACFLKNGIFNQISLICLLPLDSSPICFYSVKKMNIFQNLSNFKVSLPIFEFKLEKLSVLMCISTRLRTKYTEAWFSSIPRSRKLEVENQRLHWISKHGKSCAHCSRTRAHNSKLSNFSDSIIMILFWID